MADQFGGGASHLERYATRFNAVEINTSFYRPHKPETYARWTTSVPDDFRFAVKVPKAITHGRRLVDCDDLVAAFAGQTAHLGDKRGPLLVQLPPTLVFDPEAVEAFFADMRRCVGDDPIVCEPRHASWFDQSADRLLADHHVARVAADPAPVPQAAASSGWSGLAYTRLHGSPRIYWSRYDGAAIAQLADQAKASEVETWTVFDNTASGAAIENALEMLAVSC